MTVKLPPSFEPQIPEGDDKLRRVCQHCEFIDYENPKIVAGAVVLSGEKILLCRRAIEPRKGFWTLPAGFMEMGETVEDAARREAYEEALARIEIEQLLAIYTVPRIGQVQIMYRARLTGGYGVGPESAEVGLFSWNEIPWRDLAFPTIVWALSDYARSRHLSAFPPYGNPPGTQALTH